MSRKNNLSHTHSRRQMGRVRRFLRRLFGAQFQAMREAFGDPVPPEIREFEAESEWISQTPHGDVASPALHHRRSKPARKNKFGQ